MNLDNNISKVKNTDTSPTNGGQAQVTQPPTLAKNLDRLKVSFWVKWQEDDFLSEIESLKQSIQATATLQEKPYHCPGGFDWNVHRTGVKNYSYRLTSGDLTFLLNNRGADDKMPNMALDIGSESCWAPGYSEIFNRFVRWIEVLDGKVEKHQISEVHLAADLIGTPIDSLHIASKSRWITRSTTFTTFETFRQLSGISIGKGGTLMRIYDKILEIQTKQSVTKQHTFSEIWKCYPFGSKPVTRVEFQIRRSVLKDIKNSENSEIGIDTFTDLEESLQSVWNYCTSHWARHCNHKVDFESNHQSRAINSPIWDFITQIQWGGSASKAKQKPRPKKDYVALRKQFLGIGMTLAAFHDVNTDDIDHVIDIGKHIIEEDLISFYTSDDKEFNRRFDKKKREVYESVSTLQNLKSEHPKEYLYPTPYPPNNLCEGTNV